MMWGVGIWVVISRVLSMVAILSRLRLLRTLLMIFGWNRASNTKGFRLRGRNS